MVDANGLPVDRKPGAGQADDGHGAMPDTLKVGAALLADRAYDAEALRREIAEVDDPISRRCRSGVTGGPSTHCFTAIAIRSNAALTNSNTSAPSPHDMTKETMTSRHPYNSLQSE